MIIINMSLKLSLPTETLKEMTDMIPLTEKLLVQMDAGLYFYINQGCLTVDSINDTEEMQLVEVLESLSQRFRGDQKLIFFIKYILNVSKIVSIFCISDSQRTPSMFWDSTKMPKKWPCTGAPLPSCTSVKWNSSRGQERNKPKPTEQQVWK